MTPAEVLLAAADHIDQAQPPKADGWFQAKDFKGFYPEDAAWIALMDPTLGAHIAALLREVARLGHQRQCSEALGWGACDCTCEPTLALARHILDKAGDQ